jgi:hypothetical protein
VVGAQDSSELAKATQNPVADLISVPPGYHNVVRPNQAPEWNLRLQVQFPFPR